MDVRVNAELALKKCKLCKLLIRAFQVDAEDALAHFS